MKLQHLLLSSVIGVLGVMSCTQAGPIEVIYSGDRCDCPKKLDYLVNLPPPPPERIEFRTCEYGNELDVPLQSKAKVTYSFDSSVEEPKAAPASEQDKLDIYAKIYRIAAHEKGCLADKAVTNTCSCNRCAVAKRYLSPENRATRYVRNFRHHPNSIDNITPPTTQIMAMFLAPLKQTELGPSKMRNKRDIRRIFMRPLKNEKRSERVVKQYNIRLKDQASSKAFLSETPKPIRSKSIASARPSGVRPLQQLARLLTLPRFRNKRDIKDEYDLIEKLREQLDLTFKRNSADYGGDFPSAFKSYNLSPNPSYTFEPLTNPYVLDTLHQQNEAAPHNSYASTILERGSLVGAAYPNPSVPPVLNAQLDQWINAIVRPGFVQYQAHSHVPPYKALAVGSHLSPPYYP